MQQLFLCCDCRATQLGLPFSTQIQVPSFGAAWWLGQSWSGLRALNPSSSIVPEISSWFFHWNVSWNFQWTHWYLFSMNTLISVFSKIFKIQSKCTVFLNQITQNSKQPNILRLVESVYNTHQNICRSYASKHVSFLKNPLVLYVKWSFCLCRVRRTQLSPGVMFWIVSFCILSF